MDTQICVAAVKLTVLSPRVAVGLGRSRMRGWSDPSLWGQGTEAFHVREDGTK